MGVFDKIAKMSLKMKVIISAVLVAVIAAVVVCIVMNRGYLATTMRLLRVEGTVNIEDSNGSSRPVIDNIRFQSGDALNTGADGLASIGLDDTKIVTLQNDSRAEFIKNRKQLELKLTQGALFFEVTEHLNDDETFEIKTSTMTAGIRGTSGYVFYDDEGHSSLALTDGVVTITAVNPSTGEEKKAEIRGGQKITVYTFDDRTSETVAFEVEDYGPDELPDSVLKLLADNDALVDKICADTGWDKDIVKDLIDQAVAGTADTTEPTESDTPTPEPSMTTETTPAVTSTVTPAPSPEPTEETTAETTSPRTPSPTSPKPTSATPSSTEPSSTEATEPSSTEPSSTEPSATESSATEPSSTEATEPSESEPSVTEATEPSTETEIEVPDGYYKEVWGVEYGGHMVYICAQASDSGVNYLGYVLEIGDWVELDTDMVPGTQFFYTSDGAVYYKMEIPE